MAAHTFEKLYDMISSTSSKALFIAKGLIPWYIVGMAKAYFSRATVLNGIVIRSTVDNGIIDTVKLPPLGNRFLTVEAKDIKEKTV